MPGTLTPDPRSSTVRWWCHPPTARTTSRCYRTNSTDDPPKIVMVAFDLLYLNGYDLQFSWKRFLSGSLCGARAFATRLLAFLGEAVARFFFGAATTGAGVAQAFRPLSAQTELSSRRSRATSAAKPTIDRAVLPNEIKISPKSRQKSRYLGLGSRIPLRSSCQDARCCV